MTLQSPHVPRTASRRARRAAVLASAAVLAAAFSAQALPHAAPAPAARAPHDGASAVTRGVVHKVGVVHPRSLVSAKGRHSRVRVGLPVLLPNAGHPTTATGPVVAGARLSADTSLRPDKHGAVVHNFAGIDAMQNAATSGFNLEPPDEGLGAGHGYVANFVNVTGGIYRPGGAMALGPFYLNDFFGESADANTSDPRVFYDFDSQRWIATILEYGISGQGTISESHVDVAVSTSWDPTKSWNLYQIDTTNKNHSGCPCLADYPILGVSAQNVYVSTNEFTSDERSFNGAQLYALSKAQLVAGKGSVNTVYFQNLSMAGAPAFHVQPANEYGAADAEWLMSSLDPNGTSDDRLGVWAVTHEQRVTSGNGNPVLSYHVTPSQMYSFPPNARNPKGVCSSCNSGSGETTTGIVQTDWDAMQETQFMNGELVGALNTGMSIRGDTGLRSGVAWFVVKPMLSKGVVSGKTAVTRQGYVGMRGLYLTYPHINLLDNGDMALTFGLGGRSTYLSAAWSVAVPGRGFRVVHVSGPGAFPDNGFTGTKQYGGAARWGDYSNGEIVPGTNRVWLATQYIPNSGTGYTNWGDRVFELNVQ